MPLQFVNNTKDYNYAFKYALSDNDCHSSIYISEICSSLAGYKYVTELDMCFRVNYRELVYTEAVSDCENDHEHGHLSMIDTQDKYTFFVNKFKGM
jgi:hypothetical protein